MDSQHQKTKNTKVRGWKYYPNALSNLIHKGHCAPTVMQSILDISTTQKEWLVRLSAGMPGGIGNTGHECGGITSSLVHLGIRFGMGKSGGGLPEIFDRGHALCQNFVTCHHTLECKAIRGNDHFPRHCIPPVLRSPGLFMQAQNGYHGEPIPAGARASYTRLYDYLAEHNFHCAKAVLVHLGYSPEKDKELFDAVSAFMGGTIFMGRTCSAFTAGVMAIGLRIGEIEDNPLRVIRLLAIMTMDGNAFDDRLNKFNRSMNIGYKLSRWFTKEFDTTQCRAITQCDFSDPAGVSQYIEGGCITRCTQIAEKVASKVQAMISSMEASTI
ncbi:MAG: C-GCAxxG-C-C family (seleno)protein [Acidobacteriaceae bacterium]